MDTNIKKRKSKWDIMNLWMEEFNSTCQVILPNPPAKKNKKHLNLIKPLDTTTNLQKKKKTEQHV